MMQAFCKLTQLVKFMMINRNVWPSIAPFTYQFYKDHTNLQNWKWNLHSHTKGAFLVLTVIWINLSGLRLLGPQLTGLGCMLPQAMALSAPRSSQRCPTQLRRCWPCPRAGWTTWGMWGYDSINSLKIVWTLIFTFLTLLQLQTAGIGQIKTKKMEKVRKSRINVNKHVFRSFSFYIFCHT